MLDLVDLNKRIDKEEYEQRKDELTDKLVRLQQQCIREKLPVVLCVDGWASSGKGTTISQIVKDLDARAFVVYSMNKPTEEELRYPLMKRFWERVGQYGTMTIFDKSWYSELIKTRTGALAAENGVHMPLSSERDDATNNLIDRTDESRLFAETARTIERQLIADGYLIIKSYFHISKKKQRERLTRLQSDKTTAWRVTPQDIEQNRNYDRVYPIVDRILELTDSAAAPWHVIAADDKRVRRIEFLETLVFEIEGELERRRKSKENPVVIPANHPLPRSRYALVPMPKIEDARHDLVLSEEEYREELKKEKKKLSDLQFEMYRHQIPSLLVFEGWDAAGKGGAIKRVAAALDARDYRVYPSAAPSVVEKEHPFLWRYWMNLPKSGHIAIYDRSWYGRVMVERVEGFCTDYDWRRAFEEINDFEWELYRTGALILKFWVDVSQDEQLARFEARKNDPDKAWKLTDEDWRNREKYPQYCEAINDMMCMTSTRFAPWNIIESDNKLYARIKVLKTINAAMEERLKLEKTDAGEQRKSSRK